MFDIGNILDRLQILWNKIGVINLYYKLLKGVKWGERHVLIPWTKVRRYGIIGTNKEYSGNLKVYMIYKFKIFPYLVGVKEEGKRDGWEKPLVRTYKEVWDKYRKY